LLELGLKTLFAYLLGSVMGALLIGRLRGVDIRQLGSGNAGGTNALRTQGIGFAAGVVLVDLGKAVVAVGLLPGWDIPGVGPDPDLARPWLVVACAIGVVVGHVWPLYHDFRGGKGAATLVGALAVMAPVVLVPVLATWLVIAMASGYVGLATMVAVLTLPIAVAALITPLPWPLLVFALFMAVFIVFTHRANIVRLRAGNENRMTRLWLFRPRGAGR
jgi:glycerol-3-phosphate acyltransferase PlsY